MSKSYLNSQKPTLRFSGMVDKDGRSNSLYLKQETDRICSFILKPRKSIDIHYR